MVFTWIEWILIVAILLDVVIRTMEYIRQYYRAATGEPIDIAMRKPEVDENGKKNYHTRALVLQALKDLSCSDIHIPKESGFIYFKYQGAIFIIDADDSYKGINIIFPNWWQLEVNEKNRFLLCETINKHNGLSYIAATFFRIGDNKLNVSSKTHILTMDNPHDFKDYLSDTLDCLFQDRNDFLDNFDKLEKDYDV